MQRHHIFTIILATACGEFDPDLSDLGDDSEDTDTTEDEDTGSDTGSTDDDPDSTDTTEGTDEAETGTGTTDETGEPVCGDGMAEGDEECDGADLLGSTCEDAGFFGGGTVSCTGLCTLDVSACDEILYVQKFETDTMPPEVELVGNPLGVLVTGPMEIVDDFPWGGCFDGNNGEDWCMESGEVMADNQQSGFRITLDFVAPGEVHFFSWGWTEKFDVLEFWVDGQLLETKSENFLSPAESVWPVDTSGLHQLLWVYHKDGSLSEGFDAVWVDSITVTNAEVP